jgi:hypothetical protein
MACARATSRPLPRMTRRGSCSWTVDRASWVVTLSHAEAQTFDGRALEEGLAWRLVWVMAKQSGHPTGLDWGHALGVGHSQTA